MAIAQLTQLRISIPASGAPPGLVPADCYPGGVPSQDLPSSRRVSFAKDVTVLGDAPPPARSGGRPVIVPSLPLSPIAPDSADDSVTATMGSSRDESIFLLEVGVIVPPVGDVRSVPMADELRAVSPLPSVEGLLQDLLWAPVAPRSPDIADRRAPCSADQVPRWRLAREGPFLAERSPDTIRSFGARCAFRNTNYRASDYASSSAVPRVDWWLAF